MKRSIIIFLIFLIALGLFAKIPPLRQRVNDYANVLTTEQKLDLETYLFKIEQRTSAQIALLIIPSLEGQDIESYSMKVVQKWKLGQKHRDNGVLLLVALKDRKLRIEVGYGLEDIITDLKAGYIIRKIIVPHFKKKDYYGGIYAGLQAIGGLITKEYQISNEELAKYQRARKHNKSVFAAILNLLFILLFFIAIASRRGGLLGFILGMTIGGGFSSSDRGDSGGFFGGGGGFSGGGGSFGGGGASGGW